jgi:hypothetical protein
VLNYTDPTFRKATILPVETQMSGDPKTNEWNLLKDQFDALVHHESAGFDSIEKIFDVEFRRRFTELMNRTTERKTGYIDWSRR